MFPHALFVFICRISAGTKIDFLRTFVIRFVSRNPSRAISRRLDRFLLRPYRTFKHTTITQWGGYFCKVLRRVRDSRFEPDGYKLNRKTLLVSAALFYVTSLRCCYFDSHLSENAIKRINPVPPHIPDLYPLVVICWQKAIPSGPLETDSYYYRRGIIYAKAVGLDGVVFSY